MLNILIVEDDVNIASGLVQLMALEGFNALAAHDGQQGLSAYKNGKFDLLIIDIMMPVMDGYELCRSIRKNDSTTPIIFLSAKSSEIDKVVGLELGADDFISKPFGAREIIARIHAIIRRLAPKEIDQSSFIMADLKVSPRSNRAFRNRSKIDLSTRDIKILQLFYQNRDRVITRDMISDCAWGHEYLFNSRAIDQHIFQLRKRIEIDPQNPQIIKTVRGEGFRFEY
jgi:DNA-binding response OmpR family regulator